jgi:hypothetical protein
MTITIWLWSVPHGIVQCSEYVPAFEGVNFTVCVDPGMIVVAGIPSVLDSIPCTPVCPTIFNSTGCPAWTVISDGLNIVEEDAVTVMTKGLDTADAEIGTATPSARPNVVATSVVRMLLIAQRYISEQPVNVTSVGKRSPVSVAWRLC